MSERPSTSQTRSPYSVPSYLAKQDQEVQHLPKQVAALNLVAERAPHNFVMALFSCHGSRVCYSPLQPVKASRSHQDDEESATT